MGAHHRHHHHCQRLPRARGGGSRAALLSSAGALVALVAVAAMASSASASAHIPSRCGGDARHTLTEGKAVRAVAAAMAQAARELVGGGERLVYALPVEWSLAAQPACRGEAALAQAIDAPPARLPLRESLLDLPPPRC